MRSLSIDAFVFPPVDVGSPPSIIGLGSEWLTGPLPKRFFCFPCRFYFASWSSLFVSLSASFSCIHFKDYGLSLNQLPNLPQAMHLVRAYIRSILPFLESCCHDHWISVLEYWVGGLDSSWWILSGVFVLKFFLFKFRYHFCECNGWCGSFVQFIMTFFNLTQGCLKFFFLLLLPPMGLLFDKNSFPYRWTGALWFLCFLIVALVVGWKVR